MSCSGTALPYLTLLHKRHGTTGGVKYMEKHKYQKVVAVKGLFMLPGCGEGSLHAPRLR
jgi:hypothetical protein